MKKRYYSEPTVLVATYVCEAGFVVSSNMDGDSSVKDLGWD